MTLRNLHVTRRNVAGPWRRRRHAAAGRTAARACRGRHQDGRHLHRAGEQQWVSRIHKAATAAQARGDIEYVFSEKVTNTDYERVMREYCEAGNQLIVGEAFAVEDAARSVAKDYPDRAFLTAPASSPMPRQSELRAVFDNYIQDASYLTGIIAGAMTKSGKIGMVGRLPIPEVNRLMNAFMAGVKETRPDATFLVAFIVPGSIRPRPRKLRWPRSMPAPTCSMPSASASRMRPRRRAFWQWAMSSTPSRLSRDGGRLGALALRADAGCGHRQHQGRHLQGRRLWRLFLHEERRLQPGAARHLRGQGPGRDQGQGGAEKEAAIKSGGFNVTIGTTTSPSPT